jgi:hypothetical protein
VRVRNATRMRERPGGGGGGEGRGPEGCAAVRGAEGGAARAERRERRARRAQGAPRRVGGGWRVRGGAWAAAWAVGMAALVRSADGVPALPSGSALGFPTRLEARAWLQAAQEAVPGLLWGPAELGRTAKRDSPIEVWCAGQACPRNASGALELRGDGGTPWETLVEALNHAREPLGLFATLAWLRQLAQGVQDGVPEAQLLAATRSVWVIPVANPDGYDVNTDAAVRDKNPNHALHRKNLNDSRPCKEGGNDDADVDLHWWDDAKEDKPHVTTLDGVDTNRNFPIGWKEEYPDRYDQTALHYRCWEEYHGASPFSEAETRAMKELVEARRLEGSEGEGNGSLLTTALNVHTYGQAINVPFAYNGSGPGNRVLDKQLASFSTQLAAPMERADPNSWDVGVAKTVVGYNAFGESSDWMLAVRGEAGWGGVEWWGLVCVCVCVCVCVLWVD